jgi:hypothetical protein
MPYIEKHERGVAKERVFDDNQNTNEDRQVSEPVSSQRPAPGKRFVNARGNTRGNSINGKATKDRRRTEAFEREANYRKLSLKERVSRLQPTGAQRQRARLQRELDAHVAILKKKEEAITTAKSGEKVANGAEKKKAKKVKK